VQKLWLSYRDAKCAFLAKDDESMMGYMAPPTAAWTRPRAARSSCATSAVDLRLETARAIGLTERVAAVTKFDVRFDLNQRPFWV
jgi:hypothetical protein